MPILRKLPKRGFTNNWRKVYTTVNVSDLEKFDNDTIITAELLKSKGVIAKIEPYGLKVLGNGNLTKKLVVKAAKFTKSATEKISAAGGSIEVV
jgi:large subunit ribosomal protein L15